LDDANPYDAPLPTIGIDGVAADDRPGPRGNAVFWGFVAAASFALSIYVATNLNARWHDPWMTPRYSQSMMLWWRFGGAMAWVIMLSLPFGIAFCFDASTRRKRLIARLLTATMVLVPLILGLPT